jgi:5-methyltetrahydrofolate--homocysteine methyltransferase
MERPFSILRFTGVENGPVLFDGALGSLLISKGLPPGSMPDLCCLERPELVREAHAQYVSAGANVIQTNTFGSNRIRLSQAGGRYDAGLLNRTAVELAREAIDASNKARTGSPKTSDLKARESPARDSRARILVAGDVGPSGKLLKPIGELTPEETAEAFLEQASSLAEAGADLISIETMFNLDEAIIALKAAKRACGLPVSVCITYEKRKNGFFTVMGNTPASCVEKLIDEGADMIGSNCTLGSEDMKELARELVAATDLPVLIEPNAGQPIAKGGRVEYSESPSLFAANVAALASLGVAAVGGCCGTTPEHIEELRRTLNEQERGNIV